MSASDINIPGPPLSKFDAKLPFAYTYKLWTECVEDYPDDAAKAEQAYNKILQSIMNHDQKELDRRRAKAARKQPAEPEDNISVASSDEEEVASESENKTVKWEMPGVLAGRIGIKQSVLRTLAQARVVKTMTSPGGHRLFNVASVLRYISSQTSIMADKQACSSKLKRRKRDLDDASSESAIASCSSNERQMLVFMRLGGADQSQAKQDEAASEIQAQVFGHMKGPCTKEEMESCNFLLELEPEEPGQPFGSLFHTVATRNLLKCICSREYTRSHLILRTWDDISTERSTCALFKLLCRNMNVTVELLPRLPSQL